MHYYLHGLQKELIWVIKPSEEKPIFVSVKVRVGRFPSIKIRLSHFQPMTLATFCVTCLNNEGCQTSIFVSLGFGKGIHLYQVSRQCNHLKSLIRLLVFKRN